MGRVVIVRYVERINRVQTNKWSCRSLASILPLKIELLTRIKSPAANGLFGASIAAPGCTRIFVYRSSLSLKRTNSILPLIAFVPPAESA